jgi:hypothetical protein
MHSEVKILEFAHERRQITPHQYADYQRLKVQSFQAFFLLTVFFEALKLKRCVVSYDQSFQRGR